MITLYRMIRIWQLRIKYKMALYILLEKCMKYISENSEEIENKFVHELANIIHDSNNNNKE